MSNNQNEIGGKFTIDIDDLQKGITQANRLMKLADSEFKAAAAGMGSWADNADGLAAKQTQLNTRIDLQKAKVSALTQEYERVAAEMGENSAQAVNLKVRINNETAALEKNRKELNDVNEALDNFDDNAKDAGDSAGDFGTKAKDAALGGVKALGAAVVGLATSFFASAEATREYRTEMGKLEAAFTTAGHTTEAAKKTYEDLYAFMGEEDTAVEAANHLAKLVDNEKDLSTWTNIATGVFATFGDSLPIEGLTEAANETAKVGAVTGPLADALNWAGISEDKFNESLAKCSTEQERQAFITKTLNDVYSEASTKYKEVNADVMAANEAQSKLNDSMAKVGAMAEPVMTILKTKSAEALDAVVNLFSGFDQVIKGNMSIGDFGTQVLDKIVNGITTGAPKLLNSAVTILNNLATGIQNNLPTLLAKGLTMVDSLVVKIRENAPKLLKSGLAVIQSLASGIMNSLPVLIAKVPTIVSNIAGVINDNAPTILKAAVNIVMTIIKGIIKTIPTLVANVPKIVKAIVDVIQAFGWMNLGKSIFTFFKNGIVNMGGSVKSAATGIKDKIIDAIKNLPTKLQEMATNALKSMAGKLSGAQGITGAATGIKDKIIAAIKNLPTKLQEMATNALRSMAGKLSGAQGITGAANEIATAAINGVKNLPSNMLNIGKDLVKGLWNGINDMTGWVIGKIQGFSGNVLGGIKNFFGIKSPSRVMRDVIGKNLALGVADGVEKNTSIATKAAKGFSQSVLDAVNAPNIGPNMLSGLTSGAVAVNGAAVSGNAAAQGTIVYFTQNNTSPKALTPYEVYRQTKIANKMILEGR